MKRRPGRPKATKDESQPPIKKPSPARKKPDTAIFAVIEEASMELEAALEAFDDEEDDDSHVFAMERLQRASGLLRGTVLILRDNGGKL